MKCSSRRNCERPGGDEYVWLRSASMKCSSRRNCELFNPRHEEDVECLNEVQFPKELRDRPVEHPIFSVEASMKCSSRRNCEST